ncbi:hypothetical protein [Defluviimonas salinarum]|uniref:Uncharacterized protein n=1 Tax=Defluviimonas salinarum TaxID=2992147 RepID=A0ABT3J4J7_9RHOB|nr:hypothetical protein [Defluviimonas salinarum]MCW3782596.1 hypothetical protein [Defluviimonas salinarum]
MKINTRALMTTSGFGCIGLSYDEALGDYVESEARAVFVTESSVAAARAAQAGMAPVNPATLPDLRYGDLIVTLHWGRRIEGRHVPAGQDAGLAIEITGADGAPRRIPFTGLNMLSAREQLIAMSERGTSLSADQGGVLAGIQGVLEIISANPDTERFGGALVGQAFIASMIDGAGHVRLSVSDEEFGRKARADMIRAQISRLARDHPDGLSGAAPLATLLREAGLSSAAARSGAEVRAAGGAMVTEEALRRMVTANDRLCREVFGAMTTTPIEKLGVAMISPAELEALVEEFSDRILTGEWVDRICSRAERIAGGAMHGYSFRTCMISTDGRDILAISDPVGDAAGQAFLYSWPSVERLQIAETDAGHIVNISPEEVPDETEIARLKVVLDALICETALEQDGADPLLPVRALKMR